MDYSVSGIIHLTEAAEEVDEYCYADFPIYIKADGDGEDNR